MVILMAPPRPLVAAPEPILIAPEFPELDVPELKTSIPVDPKNPALAVLIVIGPLVVPVPSPLSRLRMPPV
jgi:hypothetical protein